MPPTARTLVARSTLLLVALAPVLVLGACGDDDSTTGATSGGSTTSSTAQEHGCAVAEGGHVRIVAKDLAWDVPCIQAPEGLQLTIDVDNQDDGVAHDLHIKGLPGGPATDLQSGPIVQHLSIGPDLKAGRYDYVCDVHTNMTGQLEILAPLPEGTVVPPQ